MIDVPATPRGNIWIGVDDRTEDEIWRALYEYLHDPEETFAFVEGSEVSVMLGGLGHLKRSFSLKEALLWDVDGYKDLVTGKIPPVHEVGDEQRPDHAAGIAQLRTLRALLVDVIAEIDAALPD